VGLAETSEWEPTFIKVKSAYECQNRKESINGVGKANINMDVEGKVTKKNNIFFKIKKTIMVYLLINSVIFFKTE